MKKLLFAAVVPLALSVPAAAAPDIDGNFDGPGVYGAPTATVVTNPDAPESNFGSPGPTARAGYSIYLTDQNNSLYAYIMNTGGAVAGAFANLYFDLNPTVGDGSDLGFEIGASGVNAFIPGMSGSKALDSSLFSFASSTTSGLTNLEFRLDNSLFASAISGLTYYPGQTFESNQTLRLSQSLSYSVAGGATFGPNRLGAFSVASVAAVPEPATWAMMLLGFGAVGYAMRRRQPKFEAVVAG